MFFLQSSLTLALYPTLAIPLSLFSLHLLDLSLSWAHTPKCSVYPAPFISASLMKERDCLTTALPALSIISFY